MERTWRLSGLEYLVMRERLVGRRNNWPFAFRSDVRGYYDFQFKKARVWGELQAAWDPALAEVLVKSLQADVRLVVHADEQHADDADITRKVMSGRRFGDRGLLIEGFHGASPDCHDQLEITECDAAALARVIVDRLPSVAAGTEPRVELLSAGEQRFDHWHGRSSLYEDDDRDVDARSLRWQAAPKGMVGSILITQGHSSFGPRGQVTKGIFWEDHPGDGRYVIDLEPPTAAVATDADGLRKLIDRHCDELRLVRQDESRRGVSRESVYDDGR
ncbi:ESX secretion-associated protein EspG [Nocardia sp. NBC_01503]|uniref:ESX secretion-associated protein EspG n=1 Tax=Nocardia sp. NBC_01503 TaxID=2975997 RepID=UPI002E7B0F44|nr:ESX secretion-associated protein EspG [Nocardia sp. NBC_01503]WTL29547.1 ESX secretion-associated protein EspG [Nocardia sp. NBC_01503]